jgi:hypothetical protein
MRFADQVEARLVQLADEAWNLGWAGDWIERLRVLWMLTPIEHPILWS